jgi:hypothetical protein
VNRWGGAARWAHDGDGDEVGLSEVVVASEREERRAVRGRPGVKASTLPFWASNLRRMTASEKPTASPKAQAPMVRVVARPSQSDATIEVTVGRARVVVRSGFDRSLLRQVLAALGGES